ncbi:succinate dehydrogenase, cytochrome b556 subunit [Acetobacter fallax]|uniref:Succinate dehydrogenase cytochrome b556 subunit n=1 Tax=Acetobacter fallax TaxID=1737473 RepID=A0ABX0K815_9PROT|nr:succinate dehydrogenase, cytochrome b556 subunit [Acetobacter fallax]NHO32544.1 succinate dehydrogenase, cytochrome b556 subunit [Acetobacter fallax]NHO36111.1 succinate dehydrogenase, cytochrome b556 subunit [Acetobacter fallax]
MQDVREALYVGSRSDGTLIRRPMSPHLQVYKMRLSMFLSISNRITGVAATAGSALGVAWLAALAKGPKSFASARRITAHPLGQLILAGWIFSLVWHTVGGLRHFIWDAGQRDDKKSVNEDGPVAVGVIAGVGVTLAVALLGVSCCRAHGRAKLRKAS